MPTINTYDDDDEHWQQIIWRFQINLWIYNEIHEIHVDLPKDLTGNP